MYALFCYSFSFDPSLWWSVRLPSKVTRGFQHHPISRNNAPQRIMVFPDSTNNKCLMMFICVL